MGVFGILCKPVEDPFSDVTRHVGDSVRCVAIWMCSNRLRTFGTQGFIGIIDCFVARPSRSIPRYTAWIGDVWPFGCKFPFSFGGQAFADVCTVRHRFVPRHIVHRSLFVIVFGRKSRLCVVFNRHQWIDEAFKRTGIVDQIVEHIRVGSDRHFCLVQIECGNGDVMLRLGVGFPVVVVGTRLQIGIAHAIGGVLRGNFHHVAGVGLIAEGVFFTAPKEC